VQTFINRMIRAARLDAGLYEEVEADAGAMGQAVGVIVLSAVAAGLGTGRGIGSIMVGSLVALLGWYVWAYLIYWIGTRLLPERETRATYDELLRCLGFAASPGLIRVLGVVPGLRGIAFLAGSIWMLVATVIATRQALDYRSTWRAVGVCAIGWVAQVILLGLALWLLGSFARAA